jgi:hypothetical protein
LTCTELDLDTWIPSAYLTYLHPVQRLKEGSSFADHNVLQGELEMNGRVTSAEDLPSYVRCCDLVKPVNDSTDLQLVGPTSEQP